MTIEAVMFQQDDPYGFSLLDRSLSSEIFDYYDQNVDVYGSHTTSSSLTTTQTHIETAAAVFSSPENKLPGGEFSDQPPTPPPRKRRRRTRSQKNLEEIENQRMTHIAVERNRRKQMNDLLSVLRSIMPSSYSHRGDQASIVGGAINYVKELEQILQSLEAQKALKSQSKSIFSDFFFFPQYYTAATASSSSGGRHHKQPTRTAVADVEVTMVEKHANIKVLTKAQPKLLIKMLTQLYSLGLSILHLNLTTSQNMTLLTFSVKIEEASPVASVDEIASAVHELVRRIQREN